MSVYEGDRSDSALKFYWNAIELRTEVNKFLVTNQVPKSWRFMLSVPTAETARSVVYNINRAEQFFPNSSYNVLERRKYYSLAIADCEQIMQDLQCMIDMGAPINVSHLERLIDKADEEIRLLKGVRKSTRLRGNPDTQQLIADAEAELERLRSL